MGLTRPIYIPSIFELTNDGKTLRLSQIFFSSMLFVIMVVLAPLEALYNDDIRWLWIIYIFLGLCFIIDVRRIYLFRQEVARQRQPIAQSGSLWQGDKEYKVIIIKPTPQEKPTDYRPPGKLFA